MLGRHDVSHKQYYPQEGFVEHDAEEIYQNTVEAIKGMVNNSQLPAADCQFSLALTNQRETVVVWNRQNATDYIVGSQWWTDSYAPADYWHDCAGANSQRIVRDEIMEDWGQRWNWLKKQ